MECSLCGSDRLEMLGALGSRAHYRCHSCGGMCSSVEEQTERDDLARAVKATPKLSRKASRIERLRWIVANHSAARIEGHLVDATTANVMVQIHDALQPENRAKFLALPLRRAADIAFKLAVQS